MNQLTRCDRLIQIRAPEFLTKALDNAANKRLTSRSDYIRVALLDRLRADGMPATEATQSFGDPGPRRPVPDRIAGGSELAAGDRQRHVELRSGIRPYRVPLHSYATKLDARSRAISESLSSKSTLVAPRARHGWRGAAAPSGADTRRREDPDGGGSRQVLP
jgi:hypothetical protein